MKPATYFDITSNLASTIRSYRLIRSSSYRQWCFVHAMSEIYCKYSLKHMQFVVVNLFDDYVEKQSPGNRFEIRHTAENRSIKSFRNECNTLPDGMRASNRKCQLFTNASKTHCWQSFRIQWKKGAKPFLFRLEFKGFAHSFCFCFSFACFNGNYYCCCCCSSVRRSKHQEEKPLNYAIWFTSVTHFCTFSCQNDISEQHPNTYTRPNGGAEKPQWNHFFGFHLYVSILCKLPHANEAT